MVLKMGFDSTTKKSNQCIWALFMVILIVLVLALIACCVYFGLEIFKLNDFESSSSEDIELLKELVQQQNATLEECESRHENFFTPSCAALPSSSPAGYYWIPDSSGQVVRMHCDISCGRVSEGWTRVFNLDMTDSSQQCPSNLRQRTDGGIRSCEINSEVAGCSETVFPSNGLRYSAVCGRMRGYQIHSSDAFGHVVRRPPLGIDDNYVDGVSLTHGTPRNHIWTFAAAHDEVSIQPEFNCPCVNEDRQDRSVPAPDFVGDDYFCATGSTDQVQDIFYSDDPLWDGMGCGPLNLCCSLNNPPWFYKELPQPTTDDIEMRVCRDQGTHDENLSIDIVEIYVQ